MRNETDEYLFNNLEIITILGNLGLPKDGKKNIPSRLIEKRRYYKGSDIWSYLRENANLPNGIDSMYDVVLAEYHTKQRPDYIPIKRTGRLQSSIE